MKISTFVLAIIMAVPVILMTGCNGSQEDYIPEVKVNLEVDLYLPSYTDLNIVSGSITDTTHGYKGLIIYRATESDFYAFDQACPYDPFDDDALVVVEPWETIAVCTKCGSQYLLTDGFPIEGPSERPLKAYNTSFDGRYLRIYN
jgi:nitrite reductase/ring-hydroxylating ferredoxin subunit